MVLKSGERQLRLVVEIPLSMTGFIHPRWCRISSINSSIIRISQFFKTELFEKNVTKHFPVT